MKIVISGGTGQIGRVLVEALRRRGDEVVVLSRGAPRGPGVVPWNGRTLGAWASEVDGADAVINLAGRSVNCRYHKANLTEMLASRIDSTRAVAQAIEAAARPPRVWLQASTATIYAHRFDAPNDEASGVIGGQEPDAPVYWRFSIEIAQAWEREMAAANTPHTRKVAMRMAIVMAPDRDGTFGILHRLTRLGLGGPIAGGAQYVSWIHDRDLARAVIWLLDRDDMQGAVNLAAPEPLPHREFMRALRAAAGVPLGLGGTRWMIEIAAALHRTDTELLLKSRRVVPSRLLDAGFRFDFPSWSSAARDLVGRVSATDSTRRVEYVKPPSQYPCGGEVEGAGARPQERGRRHPPRLVVFTGVSGIGKGRRLRSARCTPRRSGATGSRWRRTRGASFQMGISDVTAIDARSLLIRYFDTASHRERRSAFPGTTVGCDSCVR